MSAEKTAGKNKSPKRNVKKVAEMIYVAARIHAAHIHASTELARNELACKTSDAIWSIAHEVTQENHEDSYEALQMVFAAHASASFIPSVSAVSLPEVLQAPIRCCLKAIAMAKCTGLRLEALQLMRLHTSMFMPSYSIDEQLQWSVSGDPSKQDDIAALFKGLEERPDISSLWNNKVHIALLRLLDAFPKDDARYREFDDIIDNLHKSSVGHTNSH